MKTLKEVVEEAHKTRKFLVEILVADEIMQICAANNAEVDAYPPATIEEAILTEFGWLHDSGIFIHRIVKEITDVHEDSMGV
jgi:hypothetical protein